MNLNSAIYILYSMPESIFQYRQTLDINPDTLYLYHKEIYTDSIYIEIPDIKEIIIISNIISNNNSKYEIIADKNIMGRIDSISVKKYKKIYIRVYDINNYDSFNISFDVTLAKKSIRSSL